jgi:hypothetical protein
MNYMLTIVTCHCCPLQSGHIPSLCNASSISATAGTDFSESCIGQPATVSELQKYPKNNNLIAHNSKPRLCLLLKSSRETCMVVALLSQIKLCTAVSVVGNLPHFSFQAT